MKISSITDRPDVVENCHIRAQSYVSTVGGHTKDTVISVTQNETLIRTLTRVLKTPRSVHTHTHTHTHTQACTHTHTYTSMHTHTHAHTHTHTQTHTCTHTHIHTCTHIHTHTHTHIHTRLALTILYKVSILITCTQVRRFAY